MKLGVYIHGSSPFAPKVSVDKYISLSKELDQSGYHSLWFADHLIRTPDPNHSPLFETWSLIAALSRETNQIQLGTMVTPVTFREFGVFAKMVSTIDQLSNGRIILGLGTGWHRKEHHMFKIDFPSLKQRFSYLEEFIQALTALWEENNLISFDGKFVKLSDAYLNPKPVRGKIPLLIGGGGEKKTLKLVAKYADYSNFGGIQSEIEHKLEVLTQHCTDQNRNMSEITPTINRAIIMGKTEPEVRDNVDRYLGRMKELGWNLPNREELGKNRLIGTIDEVIAQIDDLSDLGIELVNLTVNDSITEKLLLDLIDRLK